MIEVFKTNVADSSQANDLVREIRDRFDSYEVNFDLEDCDRILRVISANGEVRASDIVSLLLEK